LLILNYVGLLINIINILCLFYRRRRRRCI
jgi:hypothetical protein